MKNVLPHEDALIQAILHELTPTERAGGVVYLTVGPIPAGTKLDFPRLTIEVYWEAWLAFIDRDPMANWSHSSRYLLINPVSREMRTLEAQLPPFQPGQGIHWRVVYKAPQVPDAVLPILP